MVATEPQTGRCNASITDRVGLDVYDNVLDERYLTDPPRDYDGDGPYPGETRLVAVVIERGAVRNEKPPVYTDLYEYFTNGFTITEVVLDNSETDGTAGADDDAHVYVDIEDDDPDLTHTRTEHVGYCERYPVTDRNRCPLHGGQSTGAPEGTTNNMKHGLYAKRSNYYQNKLSEDEKILVENFVDSWLEQSSYDRDHTAVTNELYRIAVDQIRLWKAQDEFADGLVTEQVIGQTEDGQPIRVDDENPANLPYDRLDRTTFSKLKDLGVLDDPESQQAAATESLAAKFESLDE